MDAKYRKIIARGICTFGAAINRNRDGHGSIVAAEPSQECAEVCDYCWHMANHILKELTNAERGKNKDIEICRQKKQTS